MKKLIAVRILLISVFMLGFAAQSQAQRAAPRIRLDGRTNKATINDSIGKTEEKRYIISFIKNSKWTVGFTSNPQSMFIAIKDIKGNILKRDTDGFVEITTGNGGDYYIVILNKHTSSQRFSFEVAKY